MNTKEGSAASVARGSSCNVSHENDGDRGGSMTITSNLEGWSVANSEKGRYMGGSAYSVTDAFLSANRRCCLGYLSRGKRINTRAVQCGALVNRADVDTFGRRGK